MALIQALDRSGAVGVHFCPQPQYFTTVTKIKMNTVI